MALIRTQNPADLPTVIRAVRAIVEETQKHTELKLFLKEWKEGEQTFWTLVMDEEDQEDLRQAAWAQTTSNVTLESLGDPTEDENYAFDQACAVHTANFKEMVKVLGIPVGFMDGDYSFVSTQWIFPDGSTKTTAETRWWYEDGEEPDPDDNFEEKKPGFFGAWDRAKVEDDEPDQESSFDTET